jgi:hypothetical protein
VFDPYLQRLIPPQNSTYVEATKYTIH